MEQIDPNDLLIFARVVDDGSFTAAAERLGLPKSTVSRRLSQLEEHLGERLLLRTTRRLSITEFGRALLDHARQVETEVAAVAALAESRQAQPSGRLRVSMPSDFANLLLTDMLAAFSAMHPAVALELDLSPRRVDLLGENFDVAVRMGELPDDALLAARRLAEFPWGLYAAPAYLAEHGEPARPEDLHQHRALRLLARSGEAIGWTLVHGESRWEGVPPGRITANSPELLIHFARAGVGIAAVPDYFAEPYVRRGELQRILPHWSRPPVIAWAVFPGRRLMPAKTRAFLDMLQAALAR
ncbi:LysR family transcriptional regulator [Thauera chlorobenzoica]|uniref:Transcriptional regulator, LysR family n=1 Tax=Thauera chlorobenzoica TaxID=96773 RepID=A0A1H5Y5P4_9RHOO|nr:LysR family transcriptional regulator [Thauera chlorobenzoica]APR04643.1 Transcriptional regulator, LysR family [Thauera chlorobenzoica]SEG19142.1 DNA-binding transcriptional regulator, LysR family [Thauera chlorobenzoica]